MPYFLRELQDVKNAVIRTVIYNVNIELLIGFDTLNIFLFFRFYPNLSK